MPVAIEEAKWSKPSQFVVGIDIGTIHSSVTYAHLQENTRPFNDRVTHWPSPVGVGGANDAKTASMLYYDSGNRVQVAGADVGTAATRLVASQRGWSLVRYFKLQMHPPNMLQGRNFNNLEELPQGLKIENVYADMIGYMLNHTRDFFNGRTSAVRWEQLAPNMTLVIAHPNGWGLKEQDRLRHAVALSGIMSEAEAQNRVCFVSEAEASVHYVLWEKSQELQPGDEFIVCDAGGSTVDTTAYRVLHEFESTPEVNHRVAPTPEKGGLLNRLFRSPDSTERLEKNKRKSMALPQGPRPKAPVCLKELKASDCQPAGGVLVNETFVAWLREQFFALPPEHGYNLDLCVRKAEESFEAQCKRQFRTSSDAMPFYVVEMSAAIQELGYPDGSIILQPDIVQGFFDKAVRMILESIRKQITGTKAKYIFLVGGFGTSQYLRQRVVNEFEKGGRKVMFLDDAHGKAASDGSIIWFVRQGVVGRAARMSFGLQVVEEYNSTVPNHRIRKQEMLPNGRYHVNGKWDLIAEKDTVYDERSPIRRTYARTYSDAYPDLGRFTVELYTWNGASLGVPEWVTDANGKINDGFSVICEIKADLSGLRGSLKKERGEKGVYYRVHFDLCLEFGGIELKAYLEWNEKKTVRRSEAKIIVTDDLLSSKNMAG
ncbi:heat shock protein 70 kDa 12A [Ceratobasidium sp. AG-Ba]|nr:heat shock protein 70 kDa 12A [Ceratobasidium sp. AG-Ba]